MEGSMVHSEGVLPQAPRGPASGIGVRAAGSPTPVGNRGFIRPYIRRRRHL